MGSPETQYQTGLTSFGVYVNFLYSYMPIIFILWCFVDIILRKFCGSTCAFFDDGNADALKNVAVRNLKYIIFGCFTVFMNFLVKFGVSYVFVSKRPMLSCVASCGMPSGEASWAVGLLTVLTLDLMLRWSRSFLTIPKEEEEDDGG